MIDQKRRIVVTGIGWVTPLGHDIEEVWAALLAGKSGVQATTNFDASTFPTTFCGEVKNLRSELDERGRSTTRLKVAYEDKAVEWLHPAERVIVYAWQTRAMDLLQQPTNQLPSPMPARRTASSPAAASWGTPRPLRSS